MNEPLRTKWQYSNVMYAAACHLVEALTGQFIGDYLRPKIWGPLKMTNTFYGLSDLKQHRGTDNLSKGYRWTRKVAGMLRYCGRINLKAEELEK